MPTDWTSGLLPENVAADVLSAAEEQSAVLALATTRQMPSGVEWLPLVEVAPTAEWINTGQRKPYSEIVLGASKLQARELALTFFVEDAYLNDSSWNPEASAEQEMSAAIARALDSAVLFGSDAPSGFPSGGIASAP
jgi:HK97 family phage major capsid protein